MEPADNSSSPPTLPWREMFRSASFRTPNTDPFVAARSSSLDDQADQIAYSSNPEIAGGHSFSMDHNHRRIINTDSDSSSVPWQVMFRSASFRRPNLSPQNHEALLMENNDPLAENAVVLLESTSANTTTMESESNNTALPSGDLPMETPVSSMENNSLSPEKVDTTTIQVESYQNILPSYPHIRSALYITMAQAGLAIIILLFYITYQLFKGYLRPILWAVICSIPLKGIQKTLVEFWSEPLRLGLMDTILAVPVAIVKVLMGTIMDAHNVYQWAFCGKKLDVLRSQGSGFLQLVRRLVSFAIFVFAYEQIGAVGAFALVGMGFMFSSNLSPSTISAVSSMRSDSFSIRNNNVEQSKLGSFITHWILSRLKTILAMGLIIGMIIGLLAGAVYFFYRISIEGKDAVISIQTHVKERKYIERLGLKRWFDENKVTKMVDWYTNECYETLLQQIDNLGLKYNLTGFVEAIKHLVISPENSYSSMVDPPHQTRYYIFRLRNLKSIIMELLFSKEGMLEKSKCFAAQGIDLFLQALASSKFIFDGSARFVISMVSGAAGILNFGLQSTVFFWVLYYLLTSKSSGITEQVIQMLPIPNSAKKKCSEALNHAISDVLLATTEIAFFQGCFTWLLCKLYSVHFVYMSTLLAFISSLLPIFPPWLPTLPAALQLAFDGRFALAISFSVAHLALMDYGASEIANDIPGYSAYLTGVSIVGGMTLFPSALEVNLSKLICDI
ncbi:hypothetical protein Nepgr_007693 [Nepenthes gracilis]|uniref:Transmembrane protein n=1 Tax=Nepenthes gracilis TaxID=150966 RepID=A0AAD3S7C6_NEPGR|nr:hypothetical protein Nepgr_007693 [Nepenthes gracilis]